MGILVQIDTTGNHKLEHASFEVFPTPGILDTVISLADNVHHQMTAAVTIGYTHTHVVGILVTNEYSSRAVIPCELLTIHDSRTAVYIDCNVVTNSSSIYSSNTNFIHHIEVIINGNIVCINGHTVV